MLQPSEIAIDHAQIESMQQELADAADMALPEGEDEEF